MLHRHAHLHLRYRLRFVRCLAEFEKGQLFEQPFRLGRQVACARGAFLDHCGILLSDSVHRRNGRADFMQAACLLFSSRGDRSEEHTSELQSLMSTSYAFVFLKKTYASIKQTHM